MESWTMFTVKGNESKWMYWFFYYFRPAISLSFTLKEAGLVRRKMIPHYNNIHYVTLTHFSQYNRLEFFLEIVICCVQSAMIMWCFIRKSFISWFCCHVSEFSAVFLLSDCHLFGMLMCFSLMSLLNTVFFFLFFF